MTALDGFLTQYGVHFDRVVETLLMLAVAALCIISIGRFTRKLLLRYQAAHHISYETLVLITRMVTICLWIAVALLILSLWGVSVTGIWTLIVSVSAVIGVGFLAVWTMVSNVTANFFLTIWHPFRMGDGVELLPENLKGRVIDRNMMYTVLRESTGGALYIPNNLFFQKMFRVIGDSEQHLFEYLETQEPKPASAMTPPTL